MSDKKSQKKQKIKGCFQQIFFALKNVEGQQVSMRGKLLIYLLVMVLIAFAVLVIGLAALGVISNADRRVGDELTLQLQNEKRQVETELDNLASQGLALSRNLGRETQQFLTENRMELKELNDNPELLEHLQDEYFGYMNATLQVSEASGVFSILDATTNTTIAVADHSRSSLYLRVNNIDLSEKVSREINLYRGIPEIGRQKGLELNNQWNLEFDTTFLPEYEEMIAIDTNDILSAYRWKKRTQLPNMWEEVMLLMIPFTGADDSVYGVCGLEFSEALFSFMHPTTQSEFGQIVTVLAPLDADGLHLEKGLVGDTQGTYLTEHQVLKADLKSNGLVFYTGEFEAYVGIQEKFSIATTDSEEDWVLCVLLPESNYQKYVKRNRMIQILVANMFLIIMVILALFISRTYVQPILDGIKSIKESGNDETGRVGYSEIDDLLLFLKEKSKDQKLEAGNLPPDIAELFDRFAQNVTTLSPAESRILGLYLEGHEINEIPDLIFVSIATVRKHNRNIYEKLEVASRDELMLYFDLFRRCGRLEELQDELKKKIDEEIVKKECIRE